jgi:hypothetical protein
MNLSPAAEPVSENHSLWRCLAQPGQQHVFRAGDADVIVAALESEVSGKPAAPGVQPFDLSTRPVQ